MRKKIIFFILLVPMVMLYIAAMVPNDIINAIKKGDSKQLSVYMNTSIELLVDNTEGIYSKQQAEQIINKFFTTNKPIGFQLVHEGGKDNQKYAIGKLKTTTGTYRVYFLIKYKNNTPLIHQLRFEKEND